MCHHVLADEPARIGQPLWVLVGRPVEQMRGFCAAQLQHDNARRLHLPFLLLVVVLDAGHASACGSGQDACDGAPRPHLGAGLPRLGQVGDERVGECTDRAADMAPAVINAGRPPVVLGRVHPDRCRHDADSDRLEAFEPDLTITKSLHWRHRIGLAHRPPDLFCFGVARNTDIACDLIVIGRDILIRDRPIKRATMLAFDLEIVWQQSGKVGEVVQRSPANAPARLVAVADRVLSLEEKRATRRLYPPSPDVGADQIGELPIRPLFQHDDFLALLYHHRGINRARSASADNDDVDFFVRRHDHHLLVGAICGMYGMPRAS